MRWFRIHTIRQRLLLSFVLMALLAAVGISIGSLVVGYFNARQEAVQRLESVVALKDTEISSWAAFLQNDLLVALNDRFADERVSILLDLANVHKHQYYDLYSKALQVRLRTLAEQSPLLQGISLMDLEGRVILPMGSDQPGGNCSGQHFFQRGLEGPFMQFPFPGAPAPTEAQGIAGSCPLIPPQDGALWAIAARPVIDEAGQVFGLIVGRADIQPLIDMLSDTTGLGQTGKVYLAEANATILRLDLDARALTWQATQIAFRSRVDNPGVYKDYRQNTVTGVYRWLPEFEIFLSAEQDLSEVSRGIYRSLTVNGVIALIAVFLAGLTSVFITRGITRPLVRVVDTASQIAEGDLDRTAPERGDDEVQMLARALNAMTAQLRDLIGNLERRVQERTGVLRRRALQLETSAQVSREITSILDIDGLLARVVDLIRDAFGYYHVQIFLADQEGNRLVLRASAGGVAGEPQPAEPLEIGTGSLNGAAAESNEAILVNDVTQDPRFLFEEYLPDTRSELVVPLRVGDRVIGTLDVQSAALNDFAPEDVLVIQSLGDQIAIAIENARLYRQARQVATAEERQRMARELHDSVIQSLYSVTLLAETGRRWAVDGDMARVISYQARLLDVAHQALKEMRLLVYELRPPALEKEGLVGALQQRLDAIEGRAGVESSLLVEDDVQLAPEEERALYGIAQEALNNVLKHAAATAVTVRIGVGDRRLELEVADNGRGFDLRAGEAAGGMGLTTMRERIEGLGGELAIQSAPGQGTTVSVRLKRGG